MSAAITGFVYSMDGTGARIDVTGYPISRGMTGYTLATASLLMDDGAVVDQVRVQSAVLAAVPVRDLAGMADSVLWRIADQDQFGLGGHALVELTRRERLASQRWRASVGVGHRAGAR